MREVSCRVFDVVFRGLRRKGIEPNVLTAGTAVSIDTLRNKHDRIDWADYVAIMRNARNIFSDDEYVEMGASFFRSPFVRPVAVIARFLFDPLAFYRWTTSPARGAGKQLFGCIEANYRELSSTAVVLELTLPPQYEVCWDFFVITLGTLIEMPRLVGAARAKVELSALPRGARYSITVPVGRAIFARIRRALAWPFTARAAARELKEAHEVLQQRLEELEEARARLDRQATQLRTAHSISNVIRADLDLEKTLQAVANALVEVGGFKFAEVGLTRDLEGRSIEQRASAGASSAEDPAIRLPLASRQREMGEVALWLQSAEEIGEKRELLEYVVPTISMALADALTYTALADYRTNLELKVEERTAELRAAQAARDRIFANVNHEIRTPLSLILLAVAELRRVAAIDERGLRALEGIYGSAVRLLQLVDGLLLLAAGQENKLELKFERSDVAGALAKAIAAWTTAADASGLAIALDAPAECICHVDVAAFDRIVANLVSNAVKFTPSPGRIDVELVPRESEIEIAVKDTGVGLDPEFKTRIFERFEQGRAAVRRGMSGSGLGLSIVKELVERHGGRISAEDNPGGGTILRLVLPRRPRESASPEPANGATHTRSAISHAEIAPSAIAVRSSDDAPIEILANDTAETTLLVAEDNPHLRRAICDLLRARYRVLAAADGNAALQLAEQHHPDMLISDVNMPGMDGLELTRRFLAGTGNRLAPVLLLTAFGNLRDRLSGFEAGAVDYIVKPFEPEELIARITSQLALRDLALRLHDSEKLASLGVLSAGLAHEIRNPANAVVNAIEPLRRLLPKEIVAQETPTGELLSIIEEAASQIARLARQLLGTTRSGSVGHQSESLPKILNRALLIVGPQTERVAITKQLGYAGSIHCAAPLIMQVLTNLIENAAHAAGEGGWVRISTRAENGRLIMDVNDSGPGVPPEIKERIFEPFFTTKPPGLGTGLGLTTSRQIVEQHGGKLHVVDGSSGSTFRLELPIEQTPAAEVRAPATRRTA
jgi:signal transduction histidine kinase